MRKRWMIWAALLVTSTTGALAAVDLAPKYPIALARGGSGGVCHCPCRSGSCDCTMHSETCHRCFDLTVNLQPMMLSAMLASGEMPVLESQDASWFEAAPYPELKIRIEASAAGSGKTEALQIRFVPDSAEPSRYVPDEAFDARAYAQFSRRIDRGKGGVLSVGAKDDPATWRIVSGGAERLNQSLEKSFRLVRRDGSSLEVFRSESTLGWEANLYLRAVVAGIPETALLGDAAEARGKLLSLLDLTDLQMKAGDASGAIQSLDTLIAAAEARWLDPAHEDTPGAVCGFRKIRNLLAPGSKCS